MKDAPDLVSTKKFYNTHTDFFHTQVTNTLYSKVYADHNKFRKGINKQRIYGLTCVKTFFTQKIFSGTRLPPNRVERNISP